MMSPISSRENIPSQTDRPSSMFRARAIPALTISGDGLVKTTQFKNPRYIGDPLNSVKIFNDCEVDELMILDISRDLKEPRFEKIQQFCAEAFMPLSYGGGIRTYSHIEKLFSLGLEKVSLNTAAFGSDRLIEKASNQFGAQSVLACIDYRKNFWGKREAMIQWGEKKLGMSPEEAAMKAVEMGAGEIILQCIDRDGEMKGYDLDLVEEISKKISVPLIVLGGAKDLLDMRRAVDAGASAAAAGSMFVYHGKLKGILINYPRQSELKKIFAASGGEG